MPEAIRVDNGQPWAAPKGSLGITRLAVKILKADIALERHSTVPLTPDLQRLHMTVSKQFLDKLDAARKGQGHAQPGASAEKVIEAALDLLLAQQAKRRAEVKRPQKNPRPAKNPNHIPAGVRREVWARDEGQVHVAARFGRHLRLHAAPRDRPRRPAGQGRPASTIDDCRLALPSTTSSPRARSTATSGWTGTPAVTHATCRWRGRRRHPGAGFLDHGKYRGHRSTFR